MPRWTRLSDYLYQYHGERVQKIPLDAGFSCPNRDGTLSSGGCIFCNPLGSGTGLGLEGMTLTAQWEEWRSRFLGREIRLFMAYLQSFSNTYGPIEKLAATLAELKNLPNMVGVAVGTRPDCVDQEKLDLIARVCTAKNWRENWVEFGVQSCKNTTLTRIRRGHDRFCAKKAIALAAEAGLKVCVHLMAGLPGETPEDFLDSVRWASEQPVRGIKFHCLYICRDTAMADMFANGEYCPLSQDEYVRLMARALPLLRPDIVVQRIVGNPGHSELLAPDWATRSHDTLNRLQAEMIRRNIRQGCMLSTA